MSSASIQADQPSGQFDVVDLGPEEPRWGDFVAGQPDALPYHHPAWSQVLQETFGYRLAALGCTDVTGRLTGVLPLVEKKSLLAGVHLSSLPNTPVAGPLAIDRASLGALLSGAAARVDHSAASWLQLKVEGPALDGLTGGFSGGTWLPSYVLDLPGDPQSLRLGGSRHNSRRNAAVRRNVSKAARQGVAVREASSFSDVRRWYRLYLVTMRAHGSPPRPLRLFEVIWDILTPLGMARWLLAERSSGGPAQLLAGSLFLAHNGVVFFAFHGHDPTQLEFRPNDAIHWSAITEACQAGRRRYDFGEVSRGNEGLARFKEKWGAVPVDLYRYHYPRQREAERGVLASGPFRRSAESAWRRLPLPVTAALGGLIYGRL
jgi:Acetyltransferase (GNAT) domain